MQIRLAMQGMFNPPEHPLQNLVFKVKRIQYRYLSDSAEEITSTKMPNAKRFQ